MRALLVLLVLAVAAVAARVLVPGEGTALPRAEPGGAGGSSEAEPASPPLLVGLEGRSGGGGLGAEAGSDRPGADPRGEDARVLRVLHEGIAASAGWDGADIDQVLADLERMMRLPIDLTPRAKASTMYESQVTGAFSGVPFATILDAVTTPRRLEWYVQEGRVRIGLLGEGPQVAAWELADMALRGTRDERLAAEALVGAAPEALRSRIATATTPPSLGPRPQPPEPPAAGGRDAGHRIRVEYRLLAAPPDFMRDVGVDVSDVGAPSSDAALTPAGCRSGITYLDDTQREVLERAAAKSGRVRDVESGTLWFWSGEERATGLEQGGILTLRCSSVGDRFVTMDVRLRFLVAGGLLFAPRSRPTLPSGGTLLVHPADTLGEGTDAVSGRLLLLTAELR